jgi:hypothetical protein
MMNSISITFKYKGVETTKEYGSGDDIPTIIKYACKINLWDEIVMIKRI